jgi:hypothetical protein
LVEIKFYDRRLRTVGGICRKLREKSSAIIKVPPLTAVYDVPAVAALNSASSNPVLISTCRLHKQRRGGGHYRSPPPWLRKTGGFALSLFLEIILKYAKLF